MRKTESGTQSDLLNCALELIHEEGLAALSYRKFGDKAGLTLGELTARIGRKDALMAALMKRTLVLQHHAHRSWQARLDAFAMCSTGELAAILSGYLREFAGVRRHEAAFWSEIVAVPRRNESENHFVRTYAKKEQQFWERLLEIWRVSNADEVSYILHYVILAESTYICTLNSISEYEIAFNLSVSAISRAIIHGISDNVSYGDVLLSKIRAQNNVNDGAEKLTGQRLQIAEAAARVIIDGGISKLTHRSAAEAVELSAASVANYFKTKVELVDAALLALHRLRRDNLEADPAQIWNRTEARGEVFVFHRAIHNITISGRINPTVRELALRERLSRGESTARWIGRGGSPVLAQVASLARYGSALVHDGPGAGGLENLDRSTLTSVFGERAET